MINLEYKFTRELSSNGVLSTNRPSTDALKSLVEWCAQGKGRCYTKKVDRDDYLIVEISFKDTDNKSGEHLSDVCQRNGLERVFLCKK